MPVAKKKSVQKKKVVKYPKTLGGIADLLYKTKVTLAEATKVAKVIEDKKKAIEAHIIDTFSAEETKGAMGKFGCVEIKSKTRYTIEDDVGFKKYIIKNKAWDLLTKALGKKGIEDRIEAGENLPFLKTFHQKVVSCTKASKD